MRRCLSFRVGSETEDGHAYVTAVGPPGYTIGFGKQQVALDVTSSTDSEHTFNWARSKLQECLKSHEDCAVNKSTLSLPR